MNSLEALTPDLFRKKLAGLTDDRGQVAFSNDSFRPLAIDLTVALALAFNRNKLDTLTLWTRIDSALGCGVSAANGGDVYALVDAACGHVHASPNAIVSAEFVGLAKPVMDLDEDAAYGFVKYLSKSRFTVIALARQSWEERRELIKRSKELAKEAEKIATQDDEVDA